MDVFSIGLQGAFAAVFVVVVMRYLADPRPVHRDLVIVAASVVGWFLVSTVSSIWPEVAPSLARITPVVILAQPILTLRLVRHFVPVSRNVMLAAAAWYVFALAIVFAFGTRGNVVATGLIVAYFVVFQSASAIMLSQAAERRVGYARTRLWVASAGSLLFAATIFVAGLASAAAQAGEATDQGLVIVSRILALAAGLAYLIAFMPPQPLRRLQQRATAFDLGQSLIASQERDPDAPGQAHAELAVRVTGGAGAVVATGDPPVVRAATGTGSPVAEGSQFEVAIGSEERVGTLRVFVDGASLFIEDARVLLG